jgi:hypothetical protein
VVQSFAGGVLGSKGLLQGSIVALLRPKDALQISFVEEDRRILEMTLCVRSIEKRYTPL